MCESIPAASILKKIVKCPTLRAIFGGKCPASRSYYDDQMPGAQSIRSIYKISIYKLGDVGISSNLIGLLSLTNGHCPPPGRWIMKQWPSGVNSRFAEVTENDSLQMQDIRIPNDTKKATKLGMIVFRDK